MYQDTQTITPTAPRRTIDIVNASLKRRYAKEARFRFMGAAAVTLGLLFVVVLFADIASKGYTAFQQTYIQVPVFFDPAILDPAGTRDPRTLAGADYLAVVKASVRKLFPDLTDRRQLHEVYALVSAGAPQQLQSMAIEHPSVIGTTRDLWLIAGADVDMLMKGHLDRTMPEADRHIKDSSIALIDRLVADGRIEKRCRPSSTMCCRWPCPAS
jgi:phosphate transport system permease protein